VTFPEVVPEIDVILFAYTLYSEVLRVGYGARRGQTARFWDWLASRFVSVNFKMAFL